MLPLTISYLFKSVWVRVRGVWLLIWGHFLAAALVSLLVLALLRLLLTSESALSFVKGPYEPLYLLLLLLFVPFACFAIKTVMEREASRPHKFGYIYADCRSMMPVFYYGWLTAFVFFMVHCAEVLTVTSFPQDRGWIVILGHLVQLFVFLLGSSAVLVALGKPCSVQEAMSRGLRLFGRHANALISTALAVCALFLLVLILALLIAHVGGSLGGFLGFSLRGVFELFALPYLVVMLGLVGRRFAVESS